MNFYVYQIYTLNLECLEDLWNKLQYYVHNPLLVKEPAVTEHCCSSQGWQCSQVRTEFAGLSPYGHLKGKKDLHFFCLKLLALLHREI